MPKKEVSEQKCSVCQIPMSQWFTCSSADVLMVAKLRDLLYEAIRELSYVQEAEDHSQCASAKGAAIVNKGMELLDVKDLSAEHLPDQEPER